VHDINLLTRSPERLDIAVGMSNGEVLVYDPFGKRSLRLNKQVRGTQSSWRRTPLHVHSWASRIVDRRCRV